MIFKNLARSLFRKAEIVVGSYVLLAVPEEDAFWKTHDEYNALSPDKRVRIINPLKPYNRQTGENCWIQRVNKPITRGFYQVVGVKDGVVVKVIQKHHPRSNSAVSDVGIRYPIYLNNILDVARDRDAMIVKRSNLK